MSEYKTDRQIAAEDKEVALQTKYLEEIETRLENQRKNLARATKQRECPHLNINYSRWGDDCKDCKVNFHNGI